MIPILSAEDWMAQLQAPANEAASGCEQAVKDILRQVRQGGDAALKQLAQKFGDPVPDVFRLPDAEVKAAVNRLPKATKTILDAAAANIRAFNSAIMQSVGPVSLDRRSFRVGMNLVPVERVACYVPGGRYPLPSTALMTALTAQAAGVSHICLLSKVLRDEIVYAGTLAGVRDFYRLSGAQGIAAVAYGTETISKVDMVVGPGNAFVTEAKRQLQGVIGIDMLAGPSEVAIIADSGADPRHVALDLLAQAEHDPDARVYCFTPDAKLARRIQAAMEDLLKTMALPDFMPNTIAQGAIIVAADLEACVTACNLLAPEHLELQVANPVAIKPLCKHYGALFMGYTATVPFGDYMAGPNHTLPTARAARFSGSLTPLTFLRPQTWIYPGPVADDLAKGSADFAALEGLVAHEAAARARISVGH